MQRCFFQTCLLALSIGWGSLVASPAVLAHGGEDHAEKPTVAAAGWLPRADAASEAFELVLVADGEHGWLYLSDFSSNSPISDATITLDIQPSHPTTVSQPQLGLTATPNTNAGSYRLDWQALAEGEYAVTATIVTAENADVLTMPLAIRAAEPFAHVHSFAEFKTAFIWVGGLLLVGVAAWLGWRRLQRGGAHA